MKEFKIYIKQFFGYDIINNSYEQQELAIQRIYCLLSSILTPIITYFIILEGKLIFKGIALSIFGISCFGLFIFSYIFINVRKNIKNILYVLFYNINIYSIINAYYFHFSADLSFAMLIALFVMSIMMDNYKKLTLFYVTSIILLIVCIWNSNYTEISKSFLISFLLTFFVISYFVLGYGIKNRIRTIEKEDFLKTIFNQIKDVFLLIDIHTGLVIDCNKSAVNFFELKSDKEIIGFPFDKFEVNDNVDNIEEIIEKLKNEKKIFYQLEFKSALDTSYLTEFTITTFNKKNSNILLARIRDITEEQKIKKYIEISEKSYKDIFNSSNELLFIEDKNKQIIDVNKSVLDRYGFTKKEIIGKTYVELSCKKNNISKINNSELAWQGIPQKFEWWSVNKNGVSFPTEIILKKGFYFGAEVLIASGRDITEKNKIMDELIKSENRFKLLSEVSLNGIVLSENSIIFDANPQFAKMHGYNSPDEILGMSFNEFLVDESVEKISKKIERDILIESVEIKTRKKDGTIINLDSVGRFLPFENKKVRVSILTEITEKKLAEKEKLRAELSELSNKTLQKEIERRIETEKILQETKYYSDSVIASSLNMICTSDLDGNIIEFNLAAQQKFGYTQNEIKGKHSSILYSEPTTYIRPNEFFINGNETFSGEVVNKTKNGEIFTSYLSASPLHNPKREVIGYMGISRDVSREKEAEKALKASLVEKEILLKEVHHRVKNNLQVISSILNLQTSYIKDEKIIQVLHESQNRIKSMSFIHESLYQTKDFSGINFKEYIQNLCTNLLYTYQVYKQHVKMEFELDDVFLNLDQSIPCGLILNELVSNALKYAFPKGKEGKIVISLTNNNNLITLSCSDNGVGIPKSINYLETESLGLQLVNTLTEQIDGKLELKKATGTKFIITFKIA